MAVILAFESHDPGTMTTTAVPSNVMKYQTIIHYVTDKRDGIIINSYRWRLYHHHGYLMIWPHRKFFFIFLVARGRHWLAMDFA
jgi:hypothetical protein